MNAKILTAVFLTLSVAACAEESSDLTGHNDSVQADPQAAADAAPPATNDDALLHTGRSYGGFEGRSLGDDRVVARAGVNRGRIKPFSALQTEYARVLGAAPASLQGAAATFGQVPKMWFEEPAANAVALQTAYAIAFDGCLTYTASAPELAAAPDAASAATQCGAMAKKFWSKTPAPQEIQACADVAVTGAAAEPDARRKWAYACASVLTSAGFLSY